MNKYTPKSIKPSPHAQTLKQMILAVMICLIPVGCQTIPAAELLSAIGNKTFTKQGEFILSTSDRISVRVENNPTLAVETVLSPSGHINFPLVGLVKISGMTLTEAERELAAKLENFVKDARVTVALAAVNSFKVYFGGQVKTPGVISLSEQTTLLKALFLAGGEATFSSGRLILIREDASGVQRRYAVKIDDLIGTSSEYLDFKIERNDLVYVE